MKHVIISGCTRGIGAACVKKFLQNGWSITGMGRSEENPFSDYSSIFKYVRGDIASTEDRKRLAMEGFYNFGRIDALVNVAGVAPLERTDILDMTEESYERVMNINTKGTMFLTQEVAKYMIKNTPENGIRGHICNISSLSAYTSSVSRGEYCISKAGVSMITKLFADRLAEYGIPVNEVRPGIIKTDMTSKVTAKYDALIEGGLLPIARWGTPEDIAAIACFLASDEGSYVNGTILRADGGITVNGDVNR